MGILYQRNLFEKRDFTSAAGLQLTWKIECDALAEDDWDAIAAIAVERLPPFKSVAGVPRGGLKLERALQKYVTTDADAYLVVDDVWTTGKSMTEFANKHHDKWVGFVAFARGPLPDHVKCFLQSPVPGEQKPVAHRIRVVDGSYCKVIPEGELEIWKQNWSTHLKSGRALLEPLYLSPPPAAGWDITDDMVERACKAYADATGYYVEFHRGLSSPSADGMRKGMRAALSALRREAPAPEGVDRPDAGGVQTEYERGFEAGRKSWGEIIEQHKAYTGELEAARPDAGGGVREQLAEALAENKALRAANTQLVLAERDRIEAALSTPPAAGGVRVKPLEWSGRSSNGKIHKAYVVPMEYWAWESAGFGYWSWGALAGREVHGGLDAAKAAAQADYERRILSALSTPPAAAERYSIEFDGFTGTVIGSYKTLEGKEGVVLQQDGTRVVHVYGRKHLKLAAVESNASVELEDARAEAADSLRTLDAIAEYVGCPHDEELTVDHVRQHYMKLENAAQRQGIEDAGRIANAQAYASVEARLREAHIEVLHGLVDACAASVIGPDKTKGSHLISMIDVIERTPSMPIDKIARWTGFIQGVLCARNIIDVDAERDRTRPILSPAVAKKSEGGVEGHARTGDEPAEPLAAVTPAGHSSEQSERNRVRKEAGIKPGPSDPTAERREIVARLNTLARYAFNEGFAQGMREETSRRGGKTWDEFGPKYEKAILAALDGGAGE